MQNVCFWLYEIVSLINTNKQYVQSSDDVRNWQSNDFEIPKGTQQIHSNPRNLHIMASSKSRGLIRWVKTNLQPRLFVLSISGCPDGILWWPSQKAEKFKAQEFYWGNFW